MTEISISSKINLTSFNHSTTITVPHPPPALMLAFHGVMALTGESISHTCDD